MYGGSCYGFDVNEEEKKIVFECIEHGEEFCTEVEFKDVDERLAELED